MNENRMNQAGFARHAKVTAQAITNAINSGKIIKHGTGRAAYIDLNCPLTVTYLANESANRHRGKGTKPQSKPKPAPPKKKVPAPAPESPANAAAVKRFLDTNDIKSLKIQEELKKLELGNRKTRGELIDRATVQAFIHGMHEIDNGHWKTLGLKISSKVAAVFGVDDDVLTRKACDVIDREVLAVLKLIKREQGKYLKKIGADKLPAKGKAA